jgi:hypothetical protein
LLGWLEPGLPPGLSCYHHYYWYGQHSSNYLPYSTCTPHLQLIGPTIEVRISFIKNKSVKLHPSILAAKMAAKKNNIIGQQQQQRHN